MSSVLHFLVALPFPFNVTKTVLPSQLFETRTANAPERLVVFREVIYMRQMFIVMREWLNIRRRFELDRDK
jgi:hypothetical protein